MRRLWLIALLCLLLPAWAGAAPKRRSTDCMGHGNCPVAATACATQRAPATEQKRRSVDRLFALSILAYALGGLALHLLLARFAGTVLATLVTILTGPAIAFWIFRSAGGLGDGWGGLAMLFLLLMLCAGGIPLALVYNAIRKRFFAGL